MLRLLWWAMVDCRSKYLNRPKVALEIARNVNSGYNLVCVVRQMFNMWLSSSDVVFCRLVIEFIRT